MSPDPELDLVLERIVDVPRALVWQAWTTPEHVCKWFAPAPWSVAECRIDLRPGGEFFTVMQSPEGEKMPGSGCYLEVVPERKLVWTDALLPGFRPAPEPFFTGMLELEDRPGGTLYRATAMHRDAATCKQHEEMGFHDGWSAALDQLVALAKGL